MNCKETKQLMLQYIDENLSTVQSLSLKEHLSVCSKCQKEFSTLKHLYSIIDDEKEEFKFNPFLSSRVNAVLANKHEQHTILMTSKRYALAASLSAAAIFVGVFVGSFFANIDPNGVQLNSNDSIELLADEYFPTSSNNIYDFQVDEIDNNK